MAAQRYPSRYCRVAAITSVRSGSIAVTWRKALFEVSCRIRVEFEAA